MRKLLNLIEEKSISVPRTLTENQDVAEDTDSQVDIYKKRLKDLIDTKVKRIQDLKNQGMKHDQAYMTAEKEYGKGYDQLLKDMPKAHSEYVQQKEKEMWAGNKWERDPLSNRSAVD